jgi:hypothetical protein
MLAEVPMRRLVLLLVLPALVGCTRSRCCPRPCPAPAPGRLHIEVVRTAPPEAPAVWTEAQRAAALEGVFELARARIARGAGSREEALAAYAHGGKILAAEAGPIPLLALRRTLEEERADLQRRPPAAPAPPVAPTEALVFYDVHDLVAAMARMGFPRVELVGPEGSRVEPPASVLGGQLYALLPAAQGPITRQQLTELEARGDMLILRASAQRHAAMNTYLATLRSAWDALWPDEIPASAPPGAPPPAPPVHAAEPLVVEIHRVADLVVAVERLGGEVDVGSPEEAPMVRLRNVLCLVVAGTQTGAASVVQVEPQGDQAFVVKARPSHQRAIGDLLQTWRREWSARWPEAFGDLPRVPSERPGPDAGHVPGK